MPSCLTDLRRCVVSLWFYSDSVEDMQVETSCCSRFGFRRRRGIGLPTGIRLTSMLHRVLFALKYSDDTGDARWGLTIGAGWQIPSAMGILTTPY